MSLFHAGWGTAAEPHSEDEPIQRLLVKAEDWQVPQPTAEARLIKLWAYQSDKDYYSLGFVEKMDPGVALVGFEREDITRGTEVIEVEDPATCSLDDVATSSPFSSVHEINTGIISGIQLIRMGHSDTGRRLIQKSLRADSGHHMSKFKSPGGEPAELMLARSCLAAAMNEITTPKPNFKAIHARITRLIADQPELESDATQSALRGLQASIDHVPGKPGSIQRIVDDYLMSGRTEGALHFNQGAHPPEELKLILTGFEAIPTLIESLDSERLTNHLMQGFNNFVSYPMSAGQVCNAYLQRFANNEMGSNWLRRQQGATAKESAVDAWWKEASAMGERAYIEKYTIAFSEKGKLRLSEELLMIADARYPDLLEPLYLTSLKSPDQSGSLKGTLAHNETIPLPDRTNLLRKGVATNQPAHRNSSLRLIRDLDEKLADQLLLDVILNAPKTAREEYWLDQDAALGQLVSKSTDREVWKAISNLIEKADLGMRMELIDHLAPDKEAPQHCKEAYLNVLNRYSDDLTIRDNSTDKRFDGPGAGFPHEKIAMRDFIHTCWASWLELKIEPPEDGAATSEWDTYRAHVEKAIKALPITPGESE